MLSIVIRLVEQLLAAPGSPSAHPAPISALDRALAEGSVI